MQDRRMLKSNKAKIRSNATEDYRSSKHEQVSAHFTQTELLPTAGIRLEPGFLSTMLVLNVLAAAVTPAMGVLVPHQTQDDTLTREVSSRMRKMDMRGTSFCVAAFKEAANANQATRRRIDNMLKHSNTPQLLCDPAQGQGVYHAQQDRMFFSGQNVVAPVDVNLVMQKFLTYQRHITQQCPALSAKDRYNPLYPNTAETRNQLLEAMKLGDERIAEFHKLLEAFKNLNVGEQLKLTTAAASGDTRLREFKKLLFQHRYRDRLELNTYQIELLEKYINASRDCLHFKLDNKRMKESDFKDLSRGASSDAMYIFDRETNSHVSYQGWEHQGGVITLHDSTFAHKFDVVAHLVEYLRVQKIDDVAERVYVINSVLSDNAMDVFYPELKKLLMEDELKCAGKLTM